MEDGDGGWVEGWREGIRALQSVWKGIKGYWIPSKAEAIDNVLANCVWVEGYTRHDSRVILCLFLYKLYCQERENS